MTQQSEASQDSPRQAATEITPEMIAAGERAFERWYAAGGLDDHDIKGLIGAILTDIGRTASPQVPDERP